MNLGMTIFVSCFVFVLVITPFSAFGDHPDIAKMVSKNYELVIDDQSYTIHYGYHGSLEADIEELKTEILLDVSSMSINTERKSLEVYLENVVEQQLFWVMIPFEVISAEGDDFILLIDGVETGYEFTKFPHDNSIGMIIPPGTKQVEIMGSSVIPEFNAILLVTLLAFIPVVLFRKFQKIGN